MGIVLRIDHGSDLHCKYVQTFRDKLVFSGFRNDFPQHTLIDATDARATRGDVEFALGSRAVNYISAGGHGTNTTFIGCDGSPIFDLSQNVALLQGKAVHLLACHTGTPLGLATAKGGVSAFWGYTAKFSFRRSSLLSNHPHLYSSDALAEVFLKMDATIDRGFLSGHDSTRIYNFVHSYVAAGYNSLTGLLNKSMFLNNFTYLACPTQNWGSASYKVL